MRSVIGSLVEGKSLDRSGAERALSELIDGPAPSEQIAAFLVGLRMKGETSDEIAGFVDCLRKRAVAVVPRRRDLVDVCGTGGDGRGTFNVSTVVAFVLAGAGQAVAKHGNRSVSSKSGSFDVLEALGVRYEGDPVAAAGDLDGLGLAFLFAPSFHPCLKVIGPVRKSLGVYTVFNALGPLLNPAPVRRQVIGVYHPALLEKLALVLRAQGAEEAMVVRGEDGVDEFSLCGPTQVAHLKAGAIRLGAMRPEDFGLKPAPLEALRGGDAQENARILMFILKGEAGPRRDMVVMNAAAALWVGGKVPDPRDGVALASQAIDSGRALDVLLKLTRDRA